MIDVENLRKEFGSTVAVDGVSFHVARGEIIGLLGPNGSGKTTIMRVLTGFFPPTSGRARIDGLEVELDPLGVKRRIGYLPENVVLYPDMPVARYLSFCGELKGLRGSRLRGRVEVVIDALGLGEMRRREIGKLSKGFRQRTGLAQALVHEPEVLVLDEPTVGLDPNQVVEIRELIRRLRGQTTILLSTHILPEASVTCDRVVIIDRGRIIAEDTAEGLHRRVQGVVQTLLRVRGPRDELLALVRAVPGVDEVSEATVPSDPSIRLRVTSKTEDVRQALARAIVERGFALVEVSPVSLTLEDLFLRLVHDERRGH